MKLAFVNAPDSYLADVLGPLPEGVEIAHWAGDGAFDLIQYFCAWRADLSRDFPKLMNSIVRNGTVWISWPKKAAKLPGDLDENVLREIGLPIGMVDVKVCAVDETWSGLKFVIRLKDR